jgi:hypothetical protein
LSINNWGAPHFGLGLTIDAALNKYHEVKRIPMIKSVSMALYIIGMVAHAVIP